MISRKRWFRYCSLVWSTIHTPRIKDIFRKYLQSISLHDLEEVDV